MARLTHTFRGKVSPLAVSRDLMLTMRAVLRVRRRLAALVLAVGVPLVLVGCSGDRDEADVRSVVDVFIEQSRIDDSAALALTDAPPGTASCLTKFGGLRDGVVEEVQVDGDEALAQVSMTIAGETTPFEMRLAREDESWRVVLDDALSIAVDISSAGIPMDLSVQHVCVVPDSAGEFAVAAPPGTYSLGVSDPTELVFTSGTPGLLPQVTLPGSTRAEFDLGTAQPSARAHSAIRAAVQEALTVCAGSGFDDPLCPSSVDGADSDGGLVDLLFGVQLKPTAEGWMFTTAPVQWRLGFVGDEDWRLLDVVAEGALSLSRSGEIEAHIVEVNDAP